MPLPTVVIGFIGSKLDGGKGPRRWERWRPTVSLCQHEDFVVDRFELVHQRKHTQMARLLAEDIEQISPETDVGLHSIEIDDPWDFEAVFATLHDFAREYPFDIDAEDYLVHITTGTHVVQICEFLLTESHHFPARLVQTQPPSRRTGPPGGYTIIDLDLSRYDAIARRFADERDEDVSFLKSGIETRNDAFNELIGQIERVAMASDAPLLLTGPTGAGKTQLARRIYELKRRRRLVKGELVEVNCATLRGDQAMSALFGHRKGAFTGAVSDRPGLLRAADGGMLFLDEIGELGLDEQAMMLKAIETGRFLPVGSDREVESDFLLIAGTNRDLSRAVASGRFREDLLARINLWTFDLPALIDRREDIEPNIDWELERWASETGERVSFNREASARFTRFATKEARWPGNFRDLNAAITRMATLAPGGRIDAATVDDEIERLRLAWASKSGQTDADRFLVSFLGEERVAELDRFDRVQLADVLQVCRECPTLSEAGRRLFAVSRAQKQNPNDADRIRKYLMRHGVDWHELKAHS
jgi:transcriptional regulatory protein RtcR